MLQAESKAVNIGSVLMNKSVVERIGIALDTNKQPVKIVAIVNKSEDPGLIKAIFEQNLGCDYGCACTVGVEVEGNTIMIDRDKIQDQKAFDLVVGMLLL